MIPHLVRRIVTGLNAAGKSVVSFIGDPTNTREIPGWPGMFVSELWVTDESPADNRGGTDRALRPIRHDPAPNGTIFRIVEIPPEEGLEVDTTKTFAAMGSHNQPGDSDRAQHFSMHKTDSVDYTVVLSGECTMLLDDDELLVRQGDCIVQRGTKHAWANRSPAPCVIAFILIDAVPLAV